MAKTITDANSYRKALLKEATKYVKNHQVAEDMVQDTLVNLWLATGRGVEINYGYMITALRRTCINFLNSSYNRNYELWGEIEATGQTNPQGLNRIMAKQEFSKLSGYKKCLTLARV